jgi:hypothetical protein
MDLGRLVDNVRRQLAVAAEAGGDDARALAERLVAPLDAALRLTLQEALASAAEEITCELAPGSVELRVRGRDLEFVVKSPPVDSPVDDAQDGDGSAEVAAVAAPEGDDREMVRINLRLPEQLKARVEQAAGIDGLSVNAWLVRAASAGLQRPEPSRPSQRRMAPGGQHYTGWAR